MGVADVSFRCPNRICKKSIAFDSLNSFNLSQGWRKTKISNKHIWNLIWNWHTTTSVILV